jgi:hypothetical protein
MNSSGCLEYSLHEPSVEFFGPGFHEKIAQVVFIVYKNILCPELHQIVTLEVE